MDFIREINAFELWTRTNYLPATSQLLWYKVFMLCNRAGWPEWITVDNLSLMSLIQIKHTHTFTECRRKLIEAGLLEFKKGSKGSPSKYKLLSVAGLGSKNEPQTAPKAKYGAKNESQTTPQNEPQTTPYSAPQTAPLYKQKQNGTEDENKGVDDDVTRAREGFAKNSANFEPQIEPQTTPQVEPQTAPNNFDFRAQGAVKLYEQNIGMLSGIVCQELVEFYNAGVEDELICKAINQALIQEKRSWAYIRAIVNNCITQNILTAAQFDINEAKRKAGKTKKGGAANGQNPNKSYDGDIFEE